MRKPSEYIAAAYRNLRANLAPDMSAVMTHGEYSAMVTRVGSRSRGEDEVIGDVPSVAIRIIALSNDFPNLAKDDAVTIDGVMHIVTECSECVADALVRVSLSQPLSRYTSVVTGIRPSGGSFRVTVEVLATAIGRADVYSDVVESGEIMEWVVVVPRRAWDWTDAPRMGDDFRADGVHFVVTDVTDRGEYWLLKARSA